MAKQKTERVEADVIGTIKDGCKVRGLRVIRLSMRPGVETGLPDLVICIPGNPFWLETKKPGEVPEPKQEHIMSELRGLGYDVDWCDKGAIGLAMIDARLARAQSNDKTTTPPTGGIDDNCDDRERVGRGAC